MSDTINFENKTIFVTGASGFIGANLVKRILTSEPSAKVIGLDSMNDYYDVRIKEARLAELQQFPDYTFVKGNLADKVLITSIFAVSSTHLEGQVLHRRCPQPAVHP